MRPKDKIYKQRHALSGVFWLFQIVVVETGKKHKMKKVTNQAEACIATVDRSHHIFSTTTADVVGLTVHCKLTATVLCRRQQLSKNFVYTTVVVAEAEATDAAGRHLVNQQPFRRSVSYSSSCFFTHNIIRVSRQLYSIYFFFKKGLYAVVGGHIFTRLFFSHNSHSPDTLLKITFLFNSQYIYNFLVSHLHSSCIYICCCFVFFQILFSRNFFIIIISFGFDAHFLCLQMVS